jgi:hypothetical protein
VAARRSVHSAFADCRGEERGGRRPALHPLVPSNVCAWRNNKHTLTQHNTHSTHHTNTNTHVHTHIRHMREHATYNTQHTQTHNTQLYPRRPSQHSQRDARQLYRRARSSVIACAYSLKTHTTTNISTTYSDTGTQTHNTQHITHKHTTYNTQHTTHTQYHAAACCLFGCPHARRAWRR